MEPTELASDPMAQLSAWIEAARDEGADVPEAFSLATASSDGAPSVRLLLARAIDADGLVFYTDRRSRKGRDLAANPRGAAAFHWPRLGRQARLAGTVQEVDAVESNAYFATRPRGSRISAWASAQGEPIPDRAALDATWVDAERRFPDDDIPLPPFWGGYRLVPEVVEFWQSRTNRLHDRIEFVRRGDGEWQRRRLQP
jgi:pyridoxamine 5'-phosphate oxidase